MSAVFHKIYGDGIVESIADGFIIINFNGVIKRFNFPSAFEKYLTTEDEGLIKRLAAENKTENNDRIEETPKVRILSSEKSTYSQSIKPQVIPFSNSISIPLIGDRAQTISVHSEAEMFELIGYMASPNRVSSFEAEIPKDGRDATFEKLFPGQKYRPIELGDTPSGMPNKLSPQFRINFANLDNCPEVLLKNMGIGTGSTVGRINKSKFVINLVQNYGFKFGDKQDISAIRSIAENRGYIDDFERGFKR